MKDLEIYNAKLNPLQKELVREYGHLVGVITGITMLADANTDPEQERLLEIKQQLGLEERQ